MDNKSTKKPSIFDNLLDETNDEEIENTIHDVFKSNKQNSQNTILNQSDDCDVMLKAFDDAFETIYGDCDEISFIQVQQISEELQTNCVNLINMVKNQNNSIETEQLRSKYNLLENESGTTIRKLENQIEELNLELKHQSSLNSIIGSTFGYYLWEATQISAVVDMVLQKDKLTNMAKLMKSILDSFIESYRNIMPSIKTYETKFVLNILGIVANLTTRQAGCHFFSQVIDGINVINAIMSLVLCTPSSLKNNLKKVGYAVLYNVSIQFNGHLLMENNKLIETLYNDIKTITNNNINDMLLFALKLLHSLSRDINESMYIIFKNQINLQEILKLTRYTKTELISRKIYENINTASIKYNNMFEQVLEKYKEDLFFLTLLLINLIRK